MHRWRRVASLADRVLSVGCRQVRILRVFERDVGENQRDVLKAGEIRWNRVIRATVAAHQLVIVPVLVIAKSSVYASYTSTAQC